MRFTKKNKNINDNDENPFSLSIGDLMSALLFIFILILSSMMLQVKQQEDSDKQITRTYQAVKTQLYIDLKDEFKDSLKVWNAIIDSTDLAVRFQEPSTLFDYNKSDLKPRFIAILRDFFPRYIQLLSKPQYKDNVEEIRIEGHTDSSGGYISNMKLSQDRTRAVLNYCLYQIPKYNFSWIAYRITANGLSSSHLIYDKNHKEDARKSRRVEFKIRTNAERQLEKIAISREK
jgi:outer membrane protein OmpA-like peptidoglycan-associated protein